MDRQKAKHRILLDSSFHFVALYSLDECSKRLMALDNQPRGLWGRARSVLFAPFGTKVAVKSKGSGLCSFYVENHNQDVSAKGTLEMLGQNETRVEGDIHIGDFVWAFGFQAVLVVAVAGFLAVYELATGTPGDVEAVIILILIGLPALVGIAINRLIRRERDLRELIEDTLRGSSVTHNSSVTERTGDP